MCGTNVALNAFSPYKKKTETIVLLMVSVFQIIYFDVPVLRE